MVYLRSYEDINDSKTLRTWFYALLHMEKASGRRVCFELLIK